MRMDGRAMVSDRLRNVILEQLELDDFELMPGTAAYEVPGWDSLRHITILIAIEHAYRIKFTTFEILKLKNVGELQNLINRKTGQS